MYHPSFNNDVINEKMDSQNQEVSLTSYRHNDGLKMKNVVFNDEY